MSNELVSRREEVMKAANAALDAAWPERKGDEYIRATRWAVGELESLAAKMRTTRLDAVEQSRTYRYLGSLHADLEPALGSEMLLKAKTCYQTAEQLLEGQSDELERAKLNFNFANALRQIDPNDIQQLQEAKRRLLAARGTFAVAAAQYVDQVDAAIRSVEGLLTVAPLASTVKENTHEMAELQEQLSAGDDVREVAAKMREVMHRGGGAAGMVGRLQSIIYALPPDLKGTPKLEQLREQMENLTKQVLEGNQPPSQEEQMWSLLTEPLKAAAAAGTVSADRLQTVTGVWNDFRRILAADDQDVGAMLSKQKRMSEFVSGVFEMAHYPSYGISWPPAGSRAADLVELNWQSRRYLLEEMARSGKGEEESKEALELSIRADRVNRRIYEAGTDEELAGIVEKEECRPLALAVRNFSARTYTMPAWPIWSSAGVPVDTNAVFYSGSLEGQALAAISCRHSGLEIMPEPKGEGFAGARWKQLQRAMTAVFDLRFANDLGLASVTYELGIALTLGKPVVVVIGEGQTMPFDVDLDPVVVAGGPTDECVLAEAIDRSVAWNFPKPRAGGSPATLEFVLSLYRRPQQNVLVDQTLKMLGGLRKEPDPLTVTRTLVQFFEYLNDGQTMLLHPRWLPFYPAGTSRRLFHVMPFRPQWADRVTAVTRKTSESAGVTYVRGDEVREPDVIRSIWEEIVRSTHVLVDLSGFNANVALELGISHTLGKKTLMVGQEDTVDRLFPAIRKLRVHKYAIKRVEQTLGRTVEDFVSS